MKPVDYAEIRRNNRNAVLDIKREDIQRMRTTIIRLNDELNEYGPQVLSEDAIVETVSILLSAGDDQRNSDNDEDNNFTNDLNTYCAIAPSISSSNVAEENHDSIIEDHINSKST